MIISKFEVMSWKNKTIEKNIQVDFNHKLNRLRQHAMKELKNSGKTNHRRDFRHKQAFKIYIPK